MREIRRSMFGTGKAKVCVFDVCKYTAAEVDEVKEINYIGLTHWVIVTGEDATEIEKDTDGTCIDDYHEYLELHFEDGSTATYRNSYVDLFVL